MRFWTVFLLCIVLAPAARAGLRVVTVGDSITNGYTPYLAAELGADWTVIGKGASGHSARQYFEQDLDDALAADPDIVCIMLGTNDAVRARTSLFNLVRFRNGMSGILDRLASFRNGRDRRPLVLLATVMPIVAPSPWVDAEPFIEEEINPWIRAASAERGVGLVDIGAQIQRQPDWLSLYREGVHLTPAGYRWMVRVWGAAVRAVVDPSCWLGDRADEVRGTVGLWAYLFGGPDRPLSGQTLSLELDGKRVASAETDADGRCLLRFALKPGQGPGELPMRLRYEGDMWTLGASAAGSLRLEVATRLLMSSRTLTVGRWAMVMARLQRVDDERPVNARRVWLSVRGERAASALTVGDGRALLLFEVPPGTEPGEYPLAVEYDGDGGYLPSRSVAILDVKRP
ncbi:MAG: hypothetical protein IT208_16975 [Chthonomonadales bacterium]|nr:hypothetical protein [Chthonomonadales bacterium]